MGKDDLSAIAAVAVFGALILGGFYMQYAIIRDCGWMALFHGAEWWWLFGYCSH